MIEERLAELVATALEASREELGLEGPLPAIEVTEPRQKEHGDFGTGVALALASRVGRPQREVAETIRRALPEARSVRRVEVAGPGFLNFFVTDDWLHEALRAIVDEGGSYGRSAPRDASAQVEFVSANPTGPLHIGHARNAALGDAIARLLDAAGWRVQREYYFNDAGRQMELFGASLEARYLQACGRDAEVPQDGYHGSYLSDVAADIRGRWGDSLAELPPGERAARLLEEGSRRVLDQIKGSLERFGVRFDSYFSERALHESGEIERAVERLREAGLAYDAEDAVWFRSTRFGDDKDRVLIRSTGQPTYFAADCAYLTDKFGRGFDRLVYVWGADHHGDVVRVKGAAQGLGHDPDAVEIVLYQFVSFLRAGEPVKMSKRAGTFVTLDELIDEVGTDAARFTLLSISNDSAMEFDIEVVKRQSMDNPVYYVQYGHARIASILRNASDNGIALRPIDEVDLSLLSTDAERDLMKDLAGVPSLVVRAAELRAPSRITHAAMDLAAAFHRFYTECRVLSEDPELTQARLWLCAGAKQVIANLLGLLGVTAPEAMHRADDEVGASSGGA